MIVIYMDVAALLELCPAHFALVPRCCAERVEGFLSEAVAATQVVDPCVPTLHAQAAII